jgi:hypothetical protein
MKQDTEVWRNVKRFRTGVDDALRSNGNHVKTFDRK